MCELAEELSNKIQDLNKEIQSMQDDVDFLKALRAAGENIRISLFNRI